MLALNVAVQALQGRRNVRDARDRAVKFAAVRAANTVAFQLRGTRAQQGEIQKAWNATFQERNRRFPTAVLRVELATRRTPVAKVMNISRDDLLRQQIRGGSRTPKNARSLLVPAPSVPRTSTGRVRKAYFRRTHRVGRYIFRKAGRGRKDYVGVLVPSAQIPKAFDLRPLVRLAGRRFRRQFNRISREEIRRFERRTR